MYMMYCYNAFDLNRKCGSCPSKITDLTVGFFEDPQTSSISHRRLELEQLQDARAQELGRFRLLTQGVVSPR